MDPRRVTEVSELVRRIEQPTPEEVGELLGHRLAGEVRRWSTGSLKLWLFYCPSVGWYEFHESTEREMMTYYLRAWRDTGEFRTWKSGPDSACQLNGYQAIGCPEPSALGSEPTLCHLYSRFSPHVLDKILRPLDPETGDPAWGEVRCVGIRSIAWGSGGVDVWYAIERPDGSGGTKKMHFYSHRHVMRCLAVTAVPNGEREPLVLLVDEYRRSRGKRVLMCPSGGEDLPTLLDVLASELKDETGSVLASGCTVRSIGRYFTDDGTCSDPVSLLVVEGLLPARGHSNPEEGIAGVVALKWTDFVRWAMSAECEDMYSRMFACMCVWDAHSREVFIQGHSEVVQLSTGER